MIRAYIITLLFLLDAAICVAATYPLRPNAADNISELGSLQSSDSLPIDRVNTTKPYKTTPANISDFIAAQGRFSAVDHSHPFANHSTATNGLLRHQDQAKLDSTLNSKAEGARCDGTWRSLASLGYTVESVATTWPHLASIVDTTAELSDYGIDWAGVQNAVSTAAAVGKPSLVAVDSGRCMLERSVDIPASGRVALVGVNGPVRTTDSNSSRVAEFFPAGSYTGPLVTMAAGSNGHAVRNILFTGATATPQTLTRAIDIGGSNSYISVTDCAFHYVQDAVRIATNSYYFEFTGNSSEGAKIYRMIVISSTAHNQAFYHANISNNRMQGTSQGGIIHAVCMYSGSYTLSLFDNVWSDNYSHSAHLVYITSNSTTATANADNNIIHDNYIYMGSIVWTHPSDIAWNGLVIQNNHFVTSGDAIVLGGNKSVIIENNDVGHTYSNYGLVYLSGHVGMLILRNNNLSPYNDGQSPFVRVASGLTLLAPRSVVLSGNVRYGNMTGPDAPLLPFGAIHQSHILSPTLFYGDTDRPVHIRSSDGDHAAPPYLDEGRVFADTSFAISKADYYPAGKIIEISNVSSSSITLSLTGTGDCQYKLTAGTLAGTYTLPARTTVRFVAERPAGYSYTRWTEL